KDLWNEYVDRYHYLMRIGHAFNVLAQYGAAFIEVVRTMGVRGFIDFVWETIAGPWLDHERVRQALATHYQLRLG
ncbi:MAG: DDE transposase family protein, partial [Deltaproteobacteria bacterium]|nr:DDE transposase family protein [Deltaproteobacteria bacterium]